MDQKSIPDEEERELLANVEIEEESVFTKNGERKEITLQIPYHTRHGNWAGFTTWLTGAFNLQAQKLIESNADLIESSEYHDEESHAVKSTEETAQLLEDLATSLRQEME
jgi:hypothetical protein